MKPTNDSTKYWPMLNKLIAHRIRPTPKLTDGGPSATPELTCCMAAPPGVMCQYPAGRDVGHLLPTPKTSRHATKCSCWILLAIPPGNIQKAAHCRRSV